ncbi:uncharacterized protein LACBIDRAFT_293616 [Laccaria bicolor S238N-H82]|uniref:Predicted protein n=1 Tax=Laccaria bicolor (strain S238N-H82 / ATCC MYA-4686) TaxID=486041 RepID=B0D4M9_LACBS|nr:uncharacterized protein LACBIDRAFT_293616 [Laccaria bicolor S238N-H82]EDR10592.1 predicted protein [Laccaria bicolor S238N-H82]|eukprot:XP_001879042.1 predicted protein [Laccaria bicolor S238N-H82]
MPDNRKHLYAASCNPPRRAKRLPVPESPLDLAQEHPDMSLPRPILPKNLPHSMKPTTNPVLSDEHAVPAQQAPAPSKRGRKPGPLSRTAREAQRRLNHSIIEKARRTKINEALATLKQLVPADYGYTKPPTDEDDEDEDNEDEEYQHGTKKPMSKKTGKKEEKEKEFKLEILVRTVSFMQDLIKKVAVLEEGATSPQPCPSCTGSGSGDPKKRKRSHLDEVDGKTQSDQSPREKNRPRRLTGSSSSGGSSYPNNTQRTPLTQPQSDARLPSISSWLPMSVIDPSLLPPPQRTPPTPRSYLPSPPSSTHFDPVRTSLVPPALSLGPIALAAPSATATSSTRPRASSIQSRTPEDESAASLLLQISASSPPFRALSSSSTYGLPDPSKFTLHPSESVKLGVLKAQTPGSLLGLNHRTGGLSGSGSESGKQ